MGGERGGLGGMAGVWAAVRPPAGRGSGRILWAAGGDAPGRRPADYTHISWLLGCRVGARSCPLNSGARCWAKSGDEPPG